MKPSPAYVGLAAIALAIALGLSASSSSAMSAHASPLKPLKSRVVIATDPELDDNNSLIRYLLYSSDFRTEGLIHASSGHHWKGDGKGARPSR
jgi:hypothetical protein